MKKNKMLRAASVLLILVMLTTSIIGGTFAKYTTTGTASDTARVAKWGVTISTDNNGAFFEKTYKKNSTSTELTVENSVVAVTNGSTQDKVVAPGTSGSTTFTIVGKPEVAFKLTAKVDITKTIKVEKDQDYEMPAGEFEVSAVKVQPTDDYEPITFKIEKESTSAGSTAWETLKVSDAGKIDATSTKEAKDLTLEQLKTALESLSAVYEANTEVNAKYRITWTWPYETPFTNWKTDTGYRTYTNADILDTYLGNETTARQEVFSIEITATQID